MTGCSSAALVVALLVPVAGPAAATAFRSRPAAPAASTTRSAAAWPTFCRSTSPGLQATAEVTGGSVDNLKLIGAGKSEVGFSMVDAAWDALQGIDKFKDNKVNARTLMVLYPNQMQVVTIEGTGINKLADLKGKRVSTGSPGSGVEVMALRVLEAMGIDPKKDIKQERLGAAESVNAIKDRKIDAFFWVGGVPTAALTDLAATPGVKIKLIDHARGGRRDEQEVRAAVREGHDSAPTAYAGQDTAEREHRRLEHPRHQRQDERQDGLRHRQDAVREEARTGRRAQGGGEHRPQEPGDVGRRCPSIPARRSTSRRRASRSSERS